MLVCKQPSYSFSSLDSLETHDFSALEAALLTLLFFVSFKLMFLGGYSLHVA